MPDFEIRTRQRPENLWPEGEAGEDLVATLPADGRRRIEESGKPAVLNPMCDDLEHDAMELLASLEHGIEEEKAEHVATRGWMRMVCDILFSTGKEDLVLTTMDAEIALRRELDCDRPDLIIEHLWAAGLIEIKDLIPDCYSGAGTLVGWKKFISVTERGKILLDVRSQPACLLAPE